MGNILDDILKAKRIDLIMQKQLISIAKLEQDMTTTAGKGRFKQELECSKLGFITEFKRKSPSKGWINREANIETVVSNYESVGATALSILTDTPFFGGKPMDLLRARELTKLPILRKDFIIDEYQVVQSAAWGADAILLIAAALPKKELHKLARLAKSLGLDTLLEVHSKEELDYINEDIDVVGVNNRNLSTFHTSIEVSIELASSIPADCLKISESGIKTAEEISTLLQLGYRGFLIGEHFMKHPDINKAFNSLNNLAYEG